MASSWRGSNAGWGICLYTHTAPGSSSLLAPVCPPLSPSPHANSFVTHPHPHTHSHTHRYGTYGTVTCPPVKKKERKKEQDTEARYPQPTRKIDTQFGIPRDGDRLFILIFLHSIWHSGLKCLRRRPFFSSSRHILKS